MKSMLGNMIDTTESEIVYTKQQRIAELAGQTPRYRMVSLNQYLTKEWLVEAFKRTRKDAVPGVDGETAKGYQERLDENLADLLERAKSGRYYAPPVKRSYIPKDKKEKRPLGIPTFEDKVLQRGIIMILEAVYEQDFYDSSHGFRPKRSAHTALERAPMKAHCQKDESLDKFLPNWRLSQLVIENNCVIER
jgi:RNA-directed DNA polymerase